MTEILFSLKNSLKSMYINLIFSFYMDDMVINIVIYCDTNICFSLYKCANPGDYRPVDIDGS